ncbi:MAG: protein kinase [Polyangiaceae bacterium]
MLAIVPLMILAPGVVIADRFTIERRAAIGGMGAVYRAIDSTTGKPVALKVLLSLTADRVARFEREASLLQSLHHPGIVSLIHFGFVPSGEPFLAMEWLEGKDLTNRLRDDGILTPAEALVFLRSAASALSVAHASGIVHRDIKPANIFLRDGRIDSVVVLDFGIAWRAETHARLTNVGTSLGTPHYMAPEQAMSDGQELGPAADVFSLGCVLFECLTGMPPFDGEQPLAILAKIVFEQAPTLRSVHPGIDPALDDLCSRMLRKDATVRIQDAVGVLAALDAMGLGRGMPSLTTLAAPAEGLTGNEQEIVCVIAVSRSKRDRDTDLSGTSDSEALASLNALGLRAETLADGTMVTTLSRPGQATDHVSRSARGAMLLKERYPDAGVALATGKARKGGRSHLPVGQVIDRVIHLMNEAIGGEGVRVDDVTAGLLDDRFLLLPAEQGTGWLRGERVMADESRPLLGKPTPCVGRERELAHLQSAWEDCTRERAARAIVLVAPPGTGKSRLRHELLRRIGAADGTFFSLVARGDPVATSGLGLIPAALRALFEIDIADDSDAEREKIRAFVASRVGPTEAPRLIEFLAYLAGVDIPDELAPRLRIARQEPRLLAEQMTRAFVDLCAALCRERPLLIVLEDLHWSDPLSIDIVGAALRELDESPIFVLALARPEIRDLHPRLWSGSVEMVSLHALRSRAAEQLAREVLRDRASTREVRRIVELSAGNALFLEELIRAVAEGRGDELPETVLAVLQARISRLLPEMRRALRAASIFGLRCTAQGVGALMVDDTHAERCLVTLVDEEILERRLGEGLDDKVEYVFRHALMRDAAYGMLVGEDRVLGHKLAGQWLEVRGADPAVLADHFHRGGDLARAVPHCVRAAEQAASRSDLDGTIRLATLGETCGAQGEDLGLVLAMRGTTLVVRETFADAHRDVARAIELLPVGHPWWCRAVGIECTMALFSRQIERATTLAQRLIDAAPQPEATFQYILSLWPIAGMACQIGQRDLARALIDRTGAVGSVALADSPFVRSWISSLQYEYMRHTRPDPWRHQHLLEDAVQASEQAGFGHDFELVILKTYLGVACAELGDHERAVITLRENVAHTRERGTGYLYSHSLIHLADALCQRSRDAPWREIESFARELLDLPDLREGFAAWARAILATALLHRGDIAEAESLTREAVRRSDHFPFRRLRMMAVLLEILVRAGKLDVAREVADEAIRSVKALGHAGYAEIAIRTSIAIAFHANGDMASAREHLVTALAEIDRQATAIPHIQLRERFLTNVRDNARAFILEREWG